MSALIGLFVWILGNRIAAFAKRPTAWPLSPLGVLTVGAYQAQIYWAVRKRALILAVMAVQI